MIKFRTEVKIIPSQSKIVYHDSLFFIGSCFAKTVGERCVKNGLRAMVNPFGVTYNPLSVLEVLRYIVDRKEVEDGYYRQVGSKWCSMLHHSSFDSDTLSEIKEKTMRSTYEAHDFINKVSYVFITLGTAWVYQNKNSGDVVNNCHKIPDNMFVRRKLTVSEIVDNFSAFVDKYEGKIIFTVSPIRHLKDTLEGNSLSKATLRVAVGELCEKYPEKVFYFPSYEIMMDDLRDYRFYEADMLHPSVVAVDYIYSLFEKFLMSDDTIDYCRRMEKISRAMEHRVGDSRSDEYEKFKKSMLANILSIKDDYPLGEYRVPIDFFK